MAMAEPRDDRPSIAGLARVSLGHSELTVRPIGLGCMGMSQFYGATDDAESIATLRAAVDMGVDFFDTSDIYGAADGTRADIRGFEHLIGNALADAGTRWCLATKFGARLNEDVPTVAAGGHAA
ncbi:aldo/keto reductase [Mycobacterium terramassiliense]|uniref:Predicted oxidoreductase (Related to aryl-alcohol dehydrogenase) n=1 Tax=Mycobacterium terramassiliense TaxID=1841859 RepID=A0A2U3N553_9MYCO|nr:aldo/keto reductase [Mycobacterium terramassiliense]SPM26662.1 Predicted oxidoreductase (related to aryl-alcohol dehydrogenase) [Mycobacterium terramassiliense]